MPLLPNVIEEPLKLLGRYRVDCVIIGGAAATLYGSTLFTNDLDVCYSRTQDNLERLASALGSVHAKLRNAPPDLPFILDSETLRRGLNFAFATNVGSLDLLGEVLGVGYYQDVVSGITKVQVFWLSFSGDRTAQVDHGKAHGATERHACGSGTGSAARQEDNF
jgi:hypothetical protein